MNEKNLIPNNERSPSEVRENGRKGGIASGNARREKKTLQKILADYLDNDVKTNKNLKKIAEAAGITGKQSIKELVAAVCILNTLKKGDVSDLQKLSALLGEETQFDDGNTDGTHSVIVAVWCFNVKYYIPAIHIITRFLYDKYIISRIKSYFNTKNILIFLEK